MRNKKRIKRILKLIEKIWEKAPDLRLYQLLGNCFPPGDHYYVEDDILERKLKEKYAYELDTLANTPTPSAFEK